MLLENNYKLKLEKQSQPETALNVIFIITMFCGFFINVLHFPSAIKYTIDLLLIFLFALSVVNLQGKRVFFSTEAKILIGWVLLFFFFTAVVYVVRYRSVLYYLWGLRNNFRLYMLFFYCILFFDKKNISSILKFVDVFFWVNTCLCIIQYLLFGLKGDHLGGFFGTEKGCNGYLNIFLVLVITKTVVFYLNKKENFWICVSKCGCSLLLATLAELKFFFIAFILIVLSGVLISDFSFRKLSIVIFGIIVVVVFATLLVHIFPYFSNFLTFDFLLGASSEGGYASSEQLNRLTTIPILSEKILTTAPLKWFGLGLGNCDTSSFDFLRTPFYDNYMHLRYNWFSTSFLFLETGFFGLIFFFGFFIAVIILCFFMLRKQKNEKEYCQMAIIAAMCCIVIGIYNSSLRTEAGFIIYFMLAFPFIVQKRAVLHE